jgi:hypothetical protein
MYGVIAGVLANVAVYAAILSLGPKIEGQAEFAQSYTFFTGTTIMVGLLVAAVLAGMSVGIISSILAMQKHLKLKHW